MSRPKYRRTVSALGDRHFTSGLEVGCSIGVLTRVLAERCDALLGVDIVEDPLEAARSRCADQPQVRFRRMQVPAEWPEGCFDLMVFSEVLYFLSAADIERCASRVRSSLLPAGMVVLVNWLGQTDDPTPGNEAAEMFIACDRREVDGHEARAARGLSFGCPGGWVIGDHRTYIRVSCPGYWRKRLTLRRRPDPPSGLNCIGQDIPR